MVAEEIKLENEERKREGNRKGADITNGKTVSVHLDAERNQTRDRSTNTREQIAKLLGVGVGTVARYDAVMKILKFILRRKRKWIIYLINLGYMIFGDY